MRLPNTATRWLRPLRILGIWLLVNAPIAGAVIWRAEGRVAGIVVAASHVVVGIYCIVVIPYFFRRAGAKYGQ